MVFGPFFCLCYNEAMKKVIPFVVLGTLTATPVVALSSETSSDLSFTFQPMLSLSLSETSLSISELYPGTFGRSNNMEVVVNTNSISGYTLSAAVGDGETYYTTNLENVTSATPFTSLATNANVETFETDNTWGYTLNSGTTYSGLPYYGETNWKVLSQTADNSGAKVIQFGIAAKAADSMASGEYKNVIQFRVVANPVPEEPEPDPGD